MIRFNYHFYSFSNRAFDANVFTNQSAYNVIGNITCKNEDKRLFPVFMLGNSFKEKNLIIISEDNYNSVLTKTRFFNYVINSSIFPLRRINITEGTFSLVYYMGKGVVLDSNYNILLCYCTDLSLVDFKTNKLSSKFYVMLNYQLLMLPENKKLLSIINSKGSIVSHAIENKFDIIQTTDINSKIFDSVDITFKSIADRKNYFQEKLNQLLSETEIKIEQPENYVEL